MKLLMAAYDRGGYTRRKSSCRLDTNVELTSCLMRQRVSSVLEFLRNRWEKPEEVMQNFKTQALREEHFRTRMVRGKRKIEDIVNS